MTLAEQLIALVEQHDLSAIGVHVYRHHDGRTSFAATAHAGDLCAWDDRQNRDAPASAIQSAIDELNKKRAAGSPVPSLVAA